MAGTAASRDKINEALELLNEAAKEKKEEFNSLLADKYGDLKGAFLGIESEMEAKALRGVRRVQDVGHEASEGLKQMAETVDKKAHEDPWKTFGWAVAGAFLAGMLFGRKK